MLKGLLARIKEKELIEKVRASKDIDAYFRLLQDGLRLSANIASKYPGNIEDLIIIGLTGWHNALKKYDLSQPFKFSTYSTYFIKKAIEENII